MAPITTTYSSNQYTIDALPNKTVNDDTNNSEKDNALCTVNEITKDLMLMAEEDGINDMMTTKPSQELDWNLGEDDEGEDDDDDMESIQNDTNGRMEEDLTQNMEKDIDEEELDDKKETSPSSGRKKVIKSVNKSNDSIADEPIPNSPKDYVAEDQDNERENSGEDNSSDDDDDNEDDDSSDDGTVAMPAEEDDATTNQIDLEEQNSSPKPSTAKDGPEDPDAWLDGSDDEGDKWRQTEQHENDSNDESETELEMPSADNVDEDTNEKTAEEEIGINNTEETPRRSARARKPRTQYSNTDSLQNISNKSKNTQKKSKIPRKKEWTNALDELFFEIEDKNSVTVKQILTSLEEKTECKMTKKWKVDVRARLHALISGKINPPGTQSDVGDLEDDDAEESEKDDADDEASLATDPGDNDSDVSDFEESKRKSSKKRKNGRKTSTRKKPTARSKKLSKRKAARAAKVMELQKQRRKQRMEELKVRNEEMQLNQSKEDQERAEAIAAKFETNTDELRLKRLEDRLDLLQRLDQKRLSVVEIKEKLVIKQEIEVLAAKEVGAKEESESDDSSSEEEHLEIVGMTKRIKPLKPLHNHLPSKSLHILDQIRSPVKKPNHSSGSMPMFSPNNLTFERMITSPGRSMNARFALRNALKHKQRKAGNRWLARELGYKTEEEHLKECKSAAEGKHELVVKLEQERLKANERKQLRERLLLQEATGYVNNEEGDESGDNETPPEGDEEDEEMQMAKAIEKEKGEITSSIAIDERSDDTADNHIEPLASDSKSELVNESDGENNEDKEENEESQALDTQPREIPMDSSLPNPSGIIQGPEKEKSDQNMSTSEFTQTAESQTLETQPFAISKPEDFVTHDKESDSLNEPRTTPYTAAASHGNTEAAKDTLPNDTIVTPQQTGEKVSDVEIEDSDEDGELDFTEGTEGNSKESIEKKSLPRNAAWQAMLKKEAEKLKKQKNKKGGLVEEEAEEEEEEEVAGLEDFGFSVSKKKKDDDEEDDEPDTLDEDDLKHVVDDVSDGEGDEDAGMEARKRSELREEKERHKEILRRMREGYDGRRGGIAGGTAGARGMHRFDQLVAADNREDAKRLGLLNDDEMDSDEEKENNKNDNDEEEDEAALLDKMLKDRFLHRSDIDLEERFSDDEEEEENEEDKDNPNDSDDEEARIQDRLAKRFAKRARMQRLEAEYGESQEFSQQRLIDEDASMKEDLKKMRNGLIRRRSTSSSLSRSSQSSFDTRGAFMHPNKRQRSDGSNSGSFIHRTTGSLSVALKASRKTKLRSSFLGETSTNASGAVEPAGIYKTVSLHHLVLNGQSSRSDFGSSITTHAMTSTTSVMGQNGKRKFAATSSTSLFSRVAKA